MISEYFVNQRSILILVWRLKTFLNVLDDHFKELLIAQVLHLRYGPQKVCL